MNKNILTIIATLFIITSATIVFAATYGRTEVYFNVPTDSAFIIRMPSTYTNISQLSTSEPGANTTPWISFNFSSPLPNSEVQPRVLGVVVDAQAGVAKPIIQYLPAGNANLTFKIRISALPQAGLTLGYNATCIYCINAGSNCGAANAAYCGTVQTALSNFSGITYVNVARNVHSSSGAVNLTMFGWATTSTQSGESTITLYHNSTIGDNT